MCTLRPVGNSRSVATPGPLGMLSLAASGWQQQVNKNKIAALLSQRTLQPQNLLVQQQRQQQGLQQLFFQQEQERRKVTAALLNNAAASAACRVRSIANNNMAQPNASSSMMMASNTASPLDRCANQIASSQPSRVDPRLGHASGEASGHHPTSQHTLIAALAKEYNVGEVELRSILNSVG
jgi:hypothetical protein